MEIFLDTSELNCIKKYAHIACGITTNPKLLSTFQNSEEVLKAIKGINAEFPNFDINLQVVSESFEQMIEEGRKIAALGKNFIVKIPITLEGIKAMHVLSNEGIRINATLCFSLFQAKLAENAGATYISPFLGRMEDSGIDIKEFLYNLTENIFESKILAASIRSTTHVELALAAGCPAITISQSICEELFGCPLSQAGQASFKEAWLFQSFNEIL